MGNENIPQIYNQQMERQCYLNQATRVGYKQVNNGLWTARFTLPADDLDNEFCTPFNYVEIYDGNRRIELFRILPSALRRAVDGYITYDCEHVIATLIDGVLFKYHEIGNIGVYTDYVITWLLDKQNKRYNHRSKTWTVDPNKKVHWRLGVCDFRHQFLYKWESENLCSALFSIPKPFIDQYQFTYDTLSYPWTVNLVRAETAVGCEIRYKKNMQAIDKIVDPSNLVTRIYPLGYGEGDNQLTIDSVNNNVPYLDADTINTYGLKEVVWTDRRFEDAENLKATALSMMNELKAPYISYAVTSIDLFKKTTHYFDEFKEGKIVRVIDTEDDINIDTRIVEIDKDDVTQAGITVTIANKDKNVAGSIADMQERARINETYAQGAANLMTIPFIDNADSDYPAVFEFFIPREMVNVNKALLRVQLLPFRGYTKAVRGGGGTTQSTTDGGATTQSTTDGGATTQTTTQQAQQSPTTSTQAQQSPTTSTNAQQTPTTSSGGSTTVTSAQDNTFQFWFMGGGFSPIDIMSVNGDPPHGHGLVPHRHDHAHSISIGAHQHNITISGHSHNVTIPAHSHSVTIPAHNHNVTIPNHNHSVTIRAHAHNMTIPDHIHSIEFGIYTGATANGITLRVDGTVIPVTDFNNIDIVRYMKADDSGRILRDSWHKLEIVPDRLTRISACLFLNIFTNSRGGGDF